jgi:hypothetical protein
LLLNCRLGFHLTGEYDSTARLSLLLIVPGI